MSRAWPVELGEDTPHGLVTLRDLRRTDGSAWTALRLRNARWLAPWEATTPEGHQQPPATFSAYVRMLRTAARAGTTLPFAITLDDALVGQLTVSQITYGSACSASIGYWVAQEVAGRGVVPTAVALAIDYCFAELGLHRIEINVRPENRPSLRVVEKLGLRDEGVRKAFLHIQGRWCDHRSFAVTAEEVPEGMLTRWRSVR